MMWVSVWEMSWMCSMLPLWKQIDVLCDALSDNICEISDSDLVFDQNPNPYSMQTPTAREYDRDNVQ